MLLSVWRLKMLVVGVYWGVFSNILCCFPCELRRFWFAFPALLVVTFSHFWSLEVFQTGAVWPGCNCISPVWTSSSQGLSHIVVRSLGGPPDHVCLKFVVVAMFRTFGRFPDEDCLTWVSFNFERLNVFQTMAHIGVNVFRRFLGFLDEGCLPRLCLCFARLEVF